MLGSCDGCPSSAATLTGGVEEALRRHWPNFRRLEVVEPDAEEAPAAMPEPEPVLLKIGRKPHAPDDADCRERRGRPGRTARPTTASPGA